MADKVVRPDELERLQAFHDYRMMPADKRSTLALLQRYQEERRNGNNVPTTNRSKIYAWKKEDDWEAQIVADEKQTQAEEREALFKIRQGQYNSMAAMLPEANKALLDLIKSTNDDAVRLRAITALYDRLGYVPESRSTAAKKRLEEDEAELTGEQHEHREMPGPDASEEEWAEYLQWQTQEGASC